MRLTRVTLWNYRSYWTDDKDPKVPPSAELALAEGVNYIVGPNNVGKSNLLRAIAIALDPTRTVDLAID
ncbi:MAG TPA: AAA family ATPase, partial [Polyangium sp.]|nr:AAA family ATPase [Polyangium sp.]